MSNKRFYLHFRINTCEVKLNPPLTSKYPVLTFYGLKKSKQILVQEVSTLIFIMLICCNLTVNLISSKCFNHDSIHEYS